MDCTEKVVQHSARWSGHTRGQRPGTAKGFVFLSLEDETGIANVIVQPDLYEKNRMVINREKFLRVEGILQNQDNVISVKAVRIIPVAISEAKVASHDFH